MVVLSVYFCLVLFNSIKVLRGYEEDEYVKLHGNDDTDVVWTRARAMKPWTLELLCEHLKWTQSDAETIKIAGAFADQGFLLFVNDSYVPRTIDMVACEIANVYANPTNVNSSGGTKRRLTNLAAKRYFYFTEGKSVDCYYLLSSGMGDKIYNLGQHKCAKLLNFRGLEDADAENEQSMQQSESPPRALGSPQFSPIRSAVTQGADTTPYNQRTQHMAADTPYLSPWAPTQYSAPHLTPNGSDMEGFSQLSHQQHLQRKERAQYSETNPQSQSAQVLGNGTQIRHRPTPGTSHIRTFADYRDS